MRGRPRSTTLWAMNAISPPAVDMHRLGEMSGEEWAALAALSDPVGVLSACVDFSSGGRHRAEAEVRPVVASMADDVKARVACLYFVDGLLDYVASGAKTEH